MRAQIQRRRLSFVSTLPRVCVRCLEIFTKRQKSNGRQASSDGDDRGAAVFAPSPHSPLCVWALLGLCSSPKKKSYRRSRALGAIEAVLLRARVAQGAARASRASAARGKASRLSLSLSACKEKASLSQQEGVEKPPPPPWCVDRYRYRYRIDRETQLQQRTRRPRRSTRWPPRRA